MPSQEIIIMNQEPHYSTSDLAARYGITRQAVWNWIKSGRLNAVRLGAVYRITESDWEQFLKSGSKPQ